jgi:hypothetical protein
MKKRTTTCVLSAILLGVSALGAAPKPGLEGARELFRQNRWEDARAHLRATDLPADQRSVARFLVGRSFVREAEAYRLTRRLSDEIGLAYLTELQAEKANRGNALIPLFTAFYHLNRRDEKEAVRLLGLATAPAARLAADWREVARARLVIARGLAAPAPARAETGIEPLYWRLITSGQVPAKLPALPAQASRRERLELACLLFRAGRGSEAESIVVGTDLTAFDAESRPDPKKLLRFFDPVSLAGWERIWWERAVAVLRPLTQSGNDTERALATHYTGLSFFHLGAFEEARPLLEQSSRSAPDADTKAVAQVLLAAAGWAARSPTSQDLGALWEATRAHPEAVLTWDELRQPALAKLEPFATRLDAQVGGLFGSTTRPSGALVGRWGFARLRRGQDAGAILTDLSAHRDHANKNKLEWNDPLLLLALSAANYRNHEYAQALETLFELSKTLTGLRELQWNLQGVYAARQKAGGEIRISQ